MPIRVIVVGAGIGGLTAAVSLRQSGCEVTILEKSSFLGEVGAALGITPDGGRVLEHLGFSFEKARTCTVKAWANIDGITYNTINCLDLSNSQQIFGAPVRTVHRVDLHTELLRLATISGQGLSKAATLKLGSQVMEAHPDGTVILCDGSRYSADMIVGADGLRSIVRDAVLGENAQAKPVHSGQAAFRFLVNTSALRSDHILSSLMDDNTERLSLLLIHRKLYKNVTSFGTPVETSSRQVQNFVGIHPIMETTTQEGHGAKVAMMAEFSHFDQRIIRMFEFAENVKRWPLYIHDPYPTWVKGRIALVGDAAHPMLPYGGQGAMIAIEDGGVLGSLFTNALPNQIDACLSKYEQLRKNRVSRVQFLSQVRAGREKEVDARISQYTDGKASSIPTTQKERAVFDYSYDAYADLKKCLTPDM